MPPFKDWLEDTIEEIDQLIKKFTKKEKRKYKLELLEKVSKRVDEFSSICGECYQYKGVITNLLHNLRGVAQLSPTVSRDHNAKINNIIRHLRKKHRLISAGAYMGIGYGIGVALGVSIGAALDNAGAGIGIGAGLGAAIGTALEAKAKKEKRII
jgi:thiamine pyrophosphate-dependent acetolactate synthase large subunit-like protein